MFHSRHYDISIKLLKIRELHYNKNVASLCSHRNVLKIDTTFVAPSKQAELPKRQRHWQHVLEDGDLIHFEDYALASYQNADDIRLSGSQIVRVSLGRERPPEGSTAMGDRICTAISTKSDKKIAAVQRAVAQRNARIKARIWSIKNDRRLRLTLHKTSFRYAKAERPLGLGPLWSLVAGDSALEFPFPRNWSPTGDGYQI